MLNVSRLRLFCLPTWRFAPVRVLTGVLGLIPMIALALWLAVTIE
jgi:hypothetical protein